MKAAIYIRVSTAKQVEQGLSLQAQKQTLQRYAEGLGYEIVACVRDAGISGKKMSNRPGIKRILAMVEKGKVGVVLVYSLSRFARNTIETLQAVKLFQKHNVALVSYTEKIDTQSAMGSFFVTMLAGLAELERQVTSDRNKHTAQYKREKGEAIGQLPWGKAKQGKKLIDAPEEIQVISRIEAYRADGMSYAKIAQALTVDGVKNKLGKCSWTAPGLSQLLKRRAINA